jgi:hypothetical protein
MRGYKGWSIYLLMFIIAPSGVVPRVSNWQQMSFVSRVTYTSHKGSRPLLDKPASDTNNIPEAQQVEVAAGALILPGLLRIPDNAPGLVLLAHGSNNIESDAHYDEPPDFSNQGWQPSLCIYSPRKRKG